MTQKAREYSSSLAGAAPPSPAREHEGEFGAGDESRPAAELVPIIADNVRLLRDERGLTHAALAALSGLEELTLARIENGTETPTIKLLWSVSTALGVPFSRLLRPVTRRESSVPRVPALVRRPVLPADPERRRQRTEVYELSLLPRSSEALAPEPPYLPATLLVTHGQLVVQHSGQSYVLAPGDSVVIPGDVERRYENRGDQRAVAYVQVSPTSSAS